MKAGYESPMIELEEFELNEAIATGCPTVVHFASDGFTRDGVYYELCSEFGDIWGEGEGTGNYPDLHYEPAAVSFVEELNCSCYYSSSDTTYFTS